MKPTTGRRVRVSAAALALVGLAACGQPAAAGDGVTIGFAAVGTPSDSTSQAWLAGMQCYTKRNGGEVKATYANLDLNKQITDVNTLVTQGAKGVFLYPLDTKALTAAIQRANSRGVAVLSMNGEGPGAVSFEPNESRQELGDITEIVRTVLPAGGKAVIVGGPPEMLAIQQQIIGFEKAAKAAGIEILGRIDSAGKNVTSLDEAGQIIAGQLLTKYPDADIIYTQNPDLGRGAALAAKDRGKISGQNFVVASSGTTPTAIEDIEAGLLTGTTDDTPWEFGYAAGEQISGHVDGKQVLPYKPEVRIWTADNLAEYQTNDQRCAAKK